MFPSILSQTHEVINQMGIQLKKGERFNLSKTSPNLTKVAIALGWEVDNKLNFSRRIKANQKNMTKNLLKKLVFRNIDSLLIKIITL